MKHILILSSVFLITGVLLTGCSGQTKPNTKTDFKLIILREDWFKLEMGYKTDPAQAKLKTADTSNPLFVVGTNEIEKYDWNLQTITLTKEATGKLVEALLSLEKRAEAIEKLKNLEAKTGWSNPLERALYIHPFIVQTNDEFRYGGIFLDAVSQMAIDFPVIRVTISDGKAVFAFLPMHIAFVMLDPIDENGDLRKAPALREDKTEIEKPKAFDETNAKIARSETAVKFRAMIRDENIKSIMQKAGKF